MEGTVTTRPFLTQHRENLEFPNCPKDSFRGAEM